MHRFGCQRDDHPRIGRRELLQVGGISLFGMGLADLARLEAQAAGNSAARGRAKSVVFIFQSGGPSQHETFDPKPEAPEGIRGEYGTTQTSLPGENFCEYLPKLSARAHRFSLVRSMHHTADRQFRNEHSSCHYLLHSGSDGIARRRYQRHDHCSACRSHGLAVDRIDDCLCRAADARRRPAGGYRDSAREQHDVSRARAGLARSALRPMGS